MSNKLNPAIVTWLASDSPEPFAYPCGTRHATALHSALRHAKAAYRAGYSIYPVEDTSGPVTLYGLKRVPWED